MARGHFDKSKERHWRRILRQWQRSGLSVRAFCRSHDLAEPSFYFWRSTLAQRDRQRNSPATPPAVSTLFAPVRLVGDVAPSLEVVCRSGQVVRVGAAFDPALLRAVVAALEEQSC
jgi:transposase-like protein